MGNDGSGWSMSVWPRHVDRIGQDSKVPKKVSVGKKPPIIKRDSAKFEAALIVAVGHKAAKKYTRRSAKMKGPR
jgi:hypothetical protein